MIDLKAAIDSANQVALAGMKSGEEIGRRESAAKIAELTAERDALDGFADLWYFAMYEAPQDFERIVTTCSPASWMSEIAKVRAAKKATT